MTKAEQKMLDRWAKEANSATLLDRFAVFVHREGGLDAATDAMLGGPAYGHACNELKDEQEWYLSSDTSDYHPENIRALLGPTAVLETVKADAEKVLEQLRSELERIGGAS